MDQSGHKHFSHQHTLITHQIPETVTVSCSGCNSAATGTAYVCWQCHFFLHEQCYRAARSLKNPSHPRHPLTLVPYPTYLSNSFYCNSCEMIGTGFSYSCAECEFDLHVQCAYSIFRPTSFRKNSRFQELDSPGWNSENSNFGYNVPFSDARNSYMAQNLQSVPVLTSYQIPETGVQDPFMAPSFNDPIASSQYLSMGQSKTESYVPVSHNYAQNPVSSGIDLSIPHPVSMDSQKPVATVYYPSISETEPSVSVSVSNNFPPNPISRVQDSVSVNTISHNPIPTFHYPSITESEPSVSIPTNLTNPVSNNEDPKIPRNEPSVSIPIDSQNIVSRDKFMTQTTESQNLIPSTQDPAMPPKKPHVSIPASSQIPTESAQIPSMSESRPSVSESNDPQNPISSFQDPSMSENIEKKDKEIKHFSHFHNLNLENFPENEDNEATCSACEDTLVGKGYQCVEPSCGFLLHESCFRLNHEIKHPSHPTHNLTLLPVAPYKNGEFTCNACFSGGSGFTYNCSICTFDLHIQCVSLPETVKRDDHEHVVKLFYACPLDGSECPVCEVCHGNIEKDRWAYYCESCDYATHLGCVDCEECEGDGDLGSSILEAQAQLQRLQIQMEMSRQQAQFMASMGASLASLV